MLPEHHFRLQTAISASLFYSIEFFQRRPLVALVTLFRDEGTRLRGWRRARHHTAAEAQTQAV